MSFEFIKKIIGVVSFAAVLLQHQHRSPRSHRGEGQGFCSHGYKAIHNIPSALSYNHCVGNNVIIPLS